VKQARLLSIAATTLAIVLAGCGGSSKSSKTSTPAAASTPSTAASTPAAAVQIATKHNKKLGTILAAGPKKLTVYLFEADKGQTSSCTGACSATWPAVAGTPNAIAGARSSALGTITRPDGTKQVTYAGHPLYTYSQDKDNGDVYGEAIKSFGAEWYVLTPAGKKVDRS
jgi:predicted lipoprotein with Yx(FWY)xxD motif